jgi:hypothetical protein
MTTNRSPRHALSETELRRQTADSLEYLYGEGRATRADVVRWVRLSAKSSGRVYQPVYRLGGRLGERLDLKRREDVEDKMFKKKAGYFKQRDRKRKGKKSGWRGSFGVFYSPMRQRWMVLYSPKHHVGTASVVGSYESFDEAERVATGKTERDRGRRGAARCSHDCIGVHTHESLARGAQGDRGKRITAAQRRSLHPESFALPARKALPLSKSPRHPIERKYVTAAASRLEGMRHRGTVSLGEYRAARRRIDAAEKHLGMGKYHRRTKHRAKRGWL